MKISSITIENAHRAKTKNLTGMNEVSAHRKVDAVFNAVIYFLSHGQRNISYAEIAEVSGVSIGSARYYIKQLIYYDAIRLQGGQQC